MRHARSETRAPITEIHHLRGLAILMIVAAHTYQFFTWRQHPFVEVLCQDAFDDSTVIFVFIAGFLFQHTEQRRFTHGEYLARKARNVITPYVLALVPAMFLVLVRHGRGLAVDSPLRGMSAEMRVAHELIYPGLSINYALWFVPVVAIYYLGAPLLLALNRHLRPAVAVLVPLSLLMHRPTYDHGHNLSLALYFLSAYVLGMLCGQERERLFGWLDQHLALVVLVFVVMFLVHLFAASHHGKSQTRAPFELQGGAGLIDWIYLQKLTMIMALIGLVRRIGRRAAAALDLFAGASFTIFFYHLYVTVVLRWFLHYTQPAFRLDLFLFVFLLMLGLPCAIASCVRAWFPRHSRPLVGA